MFHRKFAILGCVLLSAIAGARAADRSLTISVHNASLVQFSTLACAEMTASHIFAAIGIQLKWRIGPRGHSGGNGSSISMQFDSGLPRDSAPNTLAYSRLHPSSGTDIHVFIERICDGRPPRDGGALLGHVMAHEIAHILQGVNRHSDSGILKPLFDNQDRLQMTFEQLSFAPLDVDLIQNGLMRRTEQLTASAPLVSKD